MAYLGPLITRYSMTKKSNQIISKNNINPKTKIQILTPLSLQ